MRGLPTWLIMVMVPFLGVAYGYKVVVEQLIFGNTHWNATLAEENELSRREKAGEPPCPCQACEKRRLREFY